MLETITWSDAAILLGGYFLLIFTSGILVKRTLLYISEDIESKIGKDALDTGFVVGKCENFLILTFMLLDAYTALALIFAAKTIVRSEDLKTNSLFYLAGTMINVTYSIIIGLALKILILS